ncbi:hypothetical protein REPUB_Repub16aG0120700 [Reevesia pubescens]
MVVKDFPKSRACVDVFISRKRSSYGRKFGFVHFESMELALCASKRFNGTWLLAYRLGVNLAKFNA